MDVNGVVPFSNSPGRTDAQKIAHKQALQLQSDLSGVIAPPVVVKAKRERVLFSKWADLPTAANHRADREIVDVLNALPVDITLPWVLRTTSVNLIANFCVELAVYHRWITVIAHYSSQYSRIYRLIALVYQFITPMFLSAVMWVYLDRDDGECKSITNQRDCIVPESTVVPSYQKCNWYTNDQTCGFRQPQQTLQTIVYVIFIGAVVSVPIARFVEYLLIKVAVSSNPTVAPDLSGFIPATVSILKKRAPEPEATETDLDEDSELPPPKTAGEVLQRLFCDYRCRRNRVYVYNLCAEFFSEQCGSKRRAKIYAEMSDLADQTMEFSPANMARNKGPAQPKNMTLQMYKEIDQSLYALYPVTLWTRRLLNLSVPPRFRSVDFIDCMSLRDELRELISRIEEFSSHLVHKNQLVDLDFTHG